MLAYQLFTGRDFEANNYDYNRVSSTPLSDAARNDFFDNLARAATETFEEFAPESTAPLSLISQDVTNATFEGRGTIRNLPTGIAQVGLYPISGNQFLETSNANFEFPTGPDNPVSYSYNSINFSDPVAALGFYATGLEFQPEMSPTTLRLTQTNGSSVDLSIPDDSSSNLISVLYYGIIAENPSEVFTKATFLSGSSRANRFGLDDVSFAGLGQVKQVHPVPEPSIILGLFATGGFGVGLRRRRELQQKRRSKIS